MLSCQSSIVEHGRDEQDLLKAEKYKAHMVIEQGLDPFCEFFPRWFDALSAAVKETNLLPGD